jgi:hypothetical protein
MNTQASLGLELRKYIERNKRRLEKLQVGKQSFNA